ncbi:isomerase [Acrocarpospora pleiomorpha]|uniref:Isomerase n=1 Tax=Acrocarpospora pleiomorpha TaxID=90975 RepID=A0A5M3X6H9_9ACTN|nr:histidine phosphatase family protein [Acrocarpospora pleiomorpha]GES17295.1 isomerase [Acrocarpospora pleiomorpha]
MRLILARHGEIPTNVARTLDTSPPGPGLNSVGLAQARRLSRDLRPEDIQQVSSSAMTRACQTASIVADARGLSVVVRDGLHEISAGSLDLRSDEEAILAYREVTFAWATGDLGVVMPGSGTGHRVLARFDAAVELICWDGVDTALVVSHGAMIRTWVAARAIGGGFIRERTLPNTAYVILDGSMDGGWRMLAWDGLTTAD